MNTDERLNLFMLVLLTPATKSFVKNQSDILLFVCTYVKFVNLVSFDGA